eukprot:gene7031-11196_t
MSTLTMKVTRQPFENRKKLKGNPFQYQKDQFFSETETEEENEEETIVRNHKFHSEDESSMDQFTFKKEKIEKKKVLKKKAPKRKSETIIVKPTTPKKIKPVDLTCKWGENSAEEKTAHILKPSILEKIKQLKGEFDESTIVQTQRFYSKSNIPIPAEIQFFLDIKWPENLRFSHPTYEVENLEFVEFDIDTANEYAFLRDNQDYCLIGDGTCIVCTLMKQQTNFKDFDVYILDDEFKEQN